ncbi:hypothetical protein MAR_038092 [Mya arenaria]|uniref:Uncharacterized protein n=1 Tax=Mya arenaria TaxID=6604 RepID=A0ABY7FQC7_MYAAR|nr:hypothetical protein MAR_038092 [Mya arenaria]
MQAEPQMNLVWKMCREICRNSMHRNQTPRTALGHFWGLRSKEFVGKKSKVENCAILFNMSTVLVDEHCFNIYIPKSSSDYEEMSCVTTAPTSVTGGTLRCKCGIGDICN